MKKLTRGRQEEGSDFSDDDQIPMQSQYNAKKSSGSNTLGEKSARTSSSKPAKTTKSPQEISPSTPTATQADITIILEEAHLRVATIDEKLVLLSYEENKDYIIKKLKKQPAKFRPDIVHRTILAVFDSPLFKALRIRLLVKVTDGQIIEISPSMRIPRTMKRLNGLLAQALKTGQVIVPETKAVLIKVHPADKMTELLHEDTFVLGTSAEARIVHPRAYLEDLVVQKGQEKAQKAEDIKIKKPLALVVGATAQGQPCLRQDYLTDCVAISRYRLTSSLTVSKLIQALEEILL